jgi:hypothetical protein
VLERLLNQLDLNVELIMKLSMDNKGAKDHMNNCVGGRMRHIRVNY